MKRLALLMVVFALSFSCKEPLVRESFVKACQRENGAYVFDMDLSDTLASYSLSFFTRIDCPESRFRELSDICLEVSLESPAGTTYSEIVYIPKTSFSDTEYFARDCVVPYRVGFRPSDYGIWKMSVSVGGGMDVQGFRGLGLRIEKYR